MMIPTSTNAKNAVRAFFEVELREDEHHDEREDAEECHEDGHSEGSISVRVWGLSLSVHM